MDEKGLGQRLQTARKAAGMTQQMLCQKANLSYSTLAKIERGAIKSPSIFTIQNVATALGVSLDSLLGNGEVVSTKPSKITAASGVKFVYLDINGCLVQFFHSAFTKLAHDNDLSPDAVETAFWHFNDQICRGEMTMDEFNKAYAVRLGIPALDWNSYYMDAVEPMPAMQELLEWISENYHFGLLSNIMPGVIDRLFEVGMIPKMDYDVIIDSSKVGAVKPERTIYEIATEQANVKPSEILFVDDSRPNLVAAEHLGWHVLWFDGYRAAESAQRVRDALKPAI